MRDMNHVTLTGRMTADPEFKYIPSGKALAKFALANNRGTDRDGHPYPAFFFDCEVWGKGAEIIREHSYKGKQILVEGRLIQKKWKTDDGKTRDRITVAVDSFMFMGAKPDKKKKAPPSGDLPPDANPMSPPGNGAGA
jgi:single-strand DNA-binding protein